MKRLKLLGEVLSKAQQKQIYGGYDEKVTLYCKKSDPNIAPCEISLSVCPAGNEQQSTCKNSTTCYDYYHNTSCGA